MHVEFSIVQNTVQVVSKEKKHNRDVLFYTVTLQDARHKAFINKVIWIKNETLVILFFSVSLFALSWETSASRDVHKELSSYSFYFKDKIFLCNGNELDCSLITVSTNYEMFNDESGPMELNKWPLHSSDFLALIARAYCQWKTWSIWSGNCPIKRAFEIVYFNSKVTTYLPPPDDRKKIIFSIFVLQMRKVNLSNSALEAAFFSV